MTSKRETPIVKAILESLAARRVWAWRNNSGVTVLGAGSAKRVIRGAPSGSPDILCVLPGGGLAGIEVKTIDGKLRASQQRWADKALAHGVRYGVARSPREALALVDLWSESRPESKTT